MILWKLLDISLLAVIWVGATSGELEGAVAVPVNGHSNSRRGLENLVQNENVSNLQKLLFRETRSLKDVNYELEPAEGRRKNRKQSFNYHSKPKRTQYNNHNRHSDGHQGKGGYHKTDSYNSNSGYNTKSNYNKARRGDYGDGDHKKYGGKSGDSYGGQKHGGNSYGGRSGGSGGSHHSSGGKYSSGNGGHNQGHGGHYGGGGGGHHQGHGGHYGGGGGGHSHGGEYGDDSGSYLDSDGYH